MQGSATVRRGGGSVMDDDLVISLHDPHGRVVWANRAPPPATLGELIGSWPWQWVPDEEKERVKSYFAKCIALEESQQFESAALVHGERLNLYVRIDPTTGPALPIIARTRVIDSRASLLTDRERLVASLSAAGLSARQIGRKLGISSSTVDTHRHRARRKLGLPGLAALGLFALRNLPE